MFLFISKPRAVSYSLKTQLITKKFNCSHNSLFIAIWDGITFHYKQFRKYDYEYAHKFTRYIVHYWYLIEYLALFTDVKSQKYLEIRYLYQTNV